MVEENVSQETSNESSSSVEEVINEFQEEKKAAEKP